MSNPNGPDGDRHQAPGRFPFVDLIDSYWEWDVARARTVFSPLLHKLTGYTVEEVETDPEFWNKIIHPEDRNTLKELRTWALQRHSAMFDTKLRIKSKDGQWLWHLIRATIAERDAGGMPTKVSGVMFDISEQEAFKAALLETGVVLHELHSISTDCDQPLQERLTRLLIAGCGHFGLPNGIISCIKDDQYEVLAVHSAGSSIKVGDVYPLGMTFCQETLEFGGAVYFEDAGQSRFKTHPCYLEFGLATYIGIPIKVENKVYGTLNFSAPTPRQKEFSPNDNEILKLMAQWVGSALTRKKMAQTLLDTERRFQHAQRLETVGRLVSGVAHDINNLLTAVIGYTDLARLELGHEHPVDEDLTNAIAAAKRGARITRRLLGFSRPAPFAPRPLGLDEAIGDTRKLIAQMAGDGVRVATDLQAGDARVLFDPAQLDQVLMNLAVNSRDAMPVGGTISIATRHTDSEAVITFSDDGTGMDGETAGRIFEPYFTTKTHDVGTGLGLATVQSIISKAGGHLEVATEVGHGTTFTIGLPLAKEPGPAAPQVRKQPVTGQVAATVMLIESDGMVRHSVGTFLENAGHEVLTAENPKAARDIWSDRGSGISLVISDVLPQGTPGWDFALSASNDGQRPLLLFMSAYPARYLEETGHPALNYPILEKPFDFEALVLKLGQILG